MIATDITENGKFYIPTIEEFHVGFHYERLWDKPGNGWVSHIFNPFAKPESTGLEDLEYPLSHEEIRVKHLDHDDIVECGWELSQTWPGGSIYNLGKFRLCHRRNGTVRILKKKIKHHCLGPFDGAILNRSELLFIMKRLNIQP